MQRDPRDERIRQRHAAIPQDTLLGMEGFTTTDVPRTRRRYVRSVRWSACPTCENKKVGIVRSTDGREVWREHDRHTYAGAAIRCSASGTPVTK